MKQNNSLEFLKFFAALLITNSHLCGLYGQYSALATGGAIGNALFFFCSGFSLSLSKFDRFDNWYKRRFFRVMPSMLSKGVLCPLLGLNIGYITVYRMFIGGGGGWVFNAIMLFYVVIYAIQLIIRDKKSFYWTSFGILFTITCCVAFFTINEQRMLYTGSGFKQAWPGYFTTMFLGFILGKNGIKHIEKYKKASYCIISLIVAIILYYGILFVLPRTNLPVYVGIISLIPLYIILISWHMLSECKCFERLYSSKLWFPFKFVSSLCWEIYLAQLWIVLRYEELINLIAFPLNIVVCFLLIILCAYIIKALSRFIIQLFNKDSFDWKYMTQTWNR